MDNEIFTAEVGQHDTVALAAGQDGQNGHGSGQVDVRRGLWDSQLNGHTLLVTDGVFWIGKLVIKSRRKINSLEESKYNYTALRSLQLPVM